MHTPLPPDAETRLRGEIKAEMGRRDLTADALAPLAGLSAHQLYRRLSGDTPFRFVEALAIADALGISHAELVSRTTGDAA